MTGDELLRRSLGPRSPELLLEAPGWLGLAPGELVLDAGCRDATFALALARRYGCRVLGVDLVATWLPGARADAATAGLAGQVAFVPGRPRGAAAGFEVARRERIGSEWFEHRLERDPGSLTQDLLEVARLTRDRERLEAALGPVWYGRALAFALWGPQIVLGRLVPVLYVLVRRP
jgi:SAM-dependent methyltransferase